ncbi:MAG: carbohydrate-binding protein [Elusimicrobia bacterium]|nr:carbohydrate-binding protein [Elusimicrobiota bacterium]
MKTLRFSLFFFPLLFAFASSSWSDDYSINVDASSDSGSLNRFWQRSVGSCRIGMVNGSHYRDPDTGIALNHRKAYLLAAKELGFKGVRAHGILMDDVGIYHEDSQGQPVYSWEKYDELMDFIVQECGMRPIVELSYMPVDLASDPGANYAFWYGGNTSIPKDYGKWRDLIGQIVSHSVARYGKAVVDQWHWEVYNEPNLSFPGGWSEYAKLYDYAVEGAVAADPDIKIGGSAMDASGTDGYFYSFLDHCRGGTNFANQRTGTRINFFSHHVYPDNYGSVGDARFYRARHNFFSDEIGRYYSTLGLEQMITETGTSFYVFGHNDGFWESHDSGQSASFVAQAVQTLLYNSVPPPSAWSYWVISDLWEEGFQRPGDKLSYYGIMGATLRKDNIFKPVYHALKMLSLLGDRLLPVTGGSARDDYKGANAIATKSADGNQVQVLVYNQDYYTGVSHPDDTQSDGVSVTVNNLPAGWTRAHVQLFGVDKTRSNSYSAWVKAGSPEYPTDKTWADMKRDQNMVSVKEPFTASLNNGAFSDSFTALRTGVYMYVLTNPDAGPAKKCDLAVTDITWTPRFPAPGTPVVFSAVVKNQGALGSPTGMHHGVAFYVNGVKKTWSAVRNTSIPPGAAAVLTASDGVDGAAWTATEGTYRVKAEVDDVGGIPEEREDNNSLTRALEAGAAVDLPDGWHNADVGSPAARGAAGLHAGTFYVTGSGTDIGDAFHFAFKRGAGNATVSARVESLENTSVTGWEKAGVMIRESEKSNSKFAAVVVTRTHGVVFLWRSVNGGNVSYRLSSPPGYGSAPIYVKLTRRGKSLDPFYSSDGTTWFSMTGAIIPMTTDIVSGLCVTSVTDGTLNTAKFTNVANTFDRTEGGPNGLLAYYYKGIDADFSRNYFRTERLVPNVDFDWGTGQPDPLLGPDSFSVIWKGYVTPAITRRYTFHTLTDDGVRLWVNGQLLVDKWIDQGATEHSGAIDLTGGVPVPIEMRMYDRGLGAVAKLMWSAPGLGKEVIPPSAVSPGRPDLVVTNVSVTPSNPVAGEEVSFSAVIRNVGMTASPSGQLHAVAFYVDGRKFAWSTARWTGLEPGASANVEADGGVNGPRWTAEPGPHTVMAVVDDNDTLPETDEFNNKSEIPLACATAPAGRGLFGAYYNNPDFTDLRMTRVDPKIKFNWIHLSPDLSLGSDTFSVRWTGSVTPRYSEAYTFHAEADDGVRLWVDGQLIIDQWASQGATEHTGTIALTAGRPVSIRMDYYDDRVAALANLSWSSPSQAKELVPPEVLRPNGHEAERGTVGGGAAATGYYVGQMHNAGAWNQVDGVDGLAGGYKSLTIRYATNETNCVKSLFVNGVFVRRVSFPATGGWETFAVRMEPIALSSGAVNTVRLQNAAGDAGGMNIDRYETSDYSPTGVYSAEDGTVGNGAVIAGSYVAQMHHPGAWNQIGAVFGAGGGVKILKIRYACNEAGVIKSLYANGVFVRHVTFPPTGSWSAYGETQTTVTLEAGLNNTLKLENGAGDAGGVNIDSYAISDYTPGDYEAEQGAVGGGAAIQGAYVGQMHQTGAWNQISIVDGLGGGTKTLVVRYATNEAGVVKSLYVNGALVRRVNFPVTGAWDAFGATQVAIPLNAGPANVIKLLNAPGDAGGVNIDRYAVSDYVPGVYEAEWGTVGGGAAVVGYYVGSMHTVGAWSQVDGVDGGSGGTKTLRIRCAASLTDGEKGLYVNGQYRQTLYFPSWWYGWESFHDVDVPVDLNPGPVNTIRLLNSKVQSGLNIDRYGIVEP